MGRPGAPRSSPIAFCEGYKLDVCPPTDDKPFFFNMKRLEDLGRRVHHRSASAIPDPILLLLITLGILLALSALAFALPLFLVRQRRPADGRLARSSSRRSGWASCCWRSR